MYAGLFSGHKNTQTDFISDLQCSNKHKKFIHTSNLSLHDYLGSAPPGKSGTILSATMICLYQVDISAYLLLYDLHVSPVVGVKCGGRNKSPRTLFSAQLSILSG